MFSLAHQSRLAVDHLRRHLSRHLGKRASGARFDAFSERLDRHLPVLIGELAPLYGERADFLDVLAELSQIACQAWLDRPAALRTLDEHRQAHPDWFQSQQMLGGVCYVDLYGGDLEGIRARIPYFRELGLTYLHLMPLFRCPPSGNDGGYAISSYRDVEPALGTTEQLRQLAADLHQAGIALVLDFVFNHTSDEHDWARAARAGDPQFRDFYFIFPDREQPDAYERTVREIFPDEHPGAFSPLPDGRWVWTTFHSYQWDLNYANPKVFAAMAREMLFIANLGTDILRMDAVAFIWKRLGTSCENLPEAHRLIRAFNAMTRLAAPGLLFKSEAIVHPDDVVTYISPAECQLSYNPLQMALMWNTLATREVNLLQMALEERHALPEGTGWVNYVRSHDDIGWTFADEDAARLGIDARAHRHFLNRFYVNRFDGSFARGVPFQDNPQTGDCRLCGTCGSLVGLEQGDPHAVTRVLLLHGLILSAGGMPLLYLGDEVGTLNDERYLEDPARRADSRWVHRPPRNAAAYAQRTDPTTPAGRIYQGLRRMIELRRATPAFAGGRLTGFRSSNAAVLGYTRPGDEDGDVLVLANFSEAEQACPARVFSALPAEAQEMISGEALTLGGGVVLRPYQMLWLRLARR